MDEKAAKKFQARERQAQLARDDFVRAALTTLQGREYFSWAMGLGRPNENPYAGNALATAFRCGEANVSQLILKHILTAAPEGYFNILREQQKEITNDYASDPADANTGSDPSSDATGSGSAFD